MQTILDRERQKYTDMWQVEDYHKNSPGETMLPLFLDICNPEHAAWILDAGCGEGKGTLALIKAGFRVMGCDLIPNEQSLIPHIEIELWKDLYKTYSERQKYDWVYCTDVMEHIPTALTMLVIHRLLQVSIKGVFLSISFLPDSFGTWIGETLHETVQPFVWWRDHLREVGEVVEARDLLNFGVFLVRPYAEC
jgi:SAM-dependent methyltransferase